MSTSSKSANAHPTRPQDETLLGALGQYTAIAGFFLYAIFAPHSVAASSIAIAVATLGWLARTLGTRCTGLRRTQFDLPLCLFLLWTIASAFLSEEPRISIAKLQSGWILLGFYVARAVITKPTAVLLVCLLTLSGVAGTVYSLYDLTRGRGVVVESLSGNSPFRLLDLKRGDTIWRVDGHRVYSAGEVDHVLRNTPLGKSLVVSLITSGEQVERPGLHVTRELRNEVSPSGITGSNQSHRFRASGWTRHYETYSELLQIIGQLSLGLALANLHNHGTNARFKMSLAATFLLGLGIALTAMRTVLVAFLLGALLVVWRSIKGRAKFALSAALALVFVVGVLVVWQTRAEKALQLRDPSSSLRSQVASVGFSRIILHPVFGHGMDAVHQHWSEWGFPGTDMIHLHSTPLQLAFDRGLPAFGLWLWLIAAFWLAAARAERLASDLGDTNRYGILLGTVGAITAVFASSLVNYNFGDAEVALLFWWLMGVMTALASSGSANTLSNTYSPAAR